MNEAKIQFSQEELQLAENAGLILTKNTIIRKIYELFGVLAEKMKIELESVSFPEEIKHTNPKISKGENYRGLPYVVLDYPRLFTKENIFAVRTLFWWGHYFSITLHLKGVYKKKFLERIKKNIFLFAENDFYVGISKDEWAHAMHENNYMQLKEAETASYNKMLDEHDFLKLSAKINPDQWNDSERLLFRLYKIILESLR
ncbi:MAG TPA: hypothetical protein VMH01_03170 [Puia sp.]|nr:hypothetical protein [Puia sp.]